MGVILDKLWISNGQLVSPKKLCPAPATSHRCLPPTCDASRFHSRRVYLQVQIWLGHELDPTKWGWDIQKKNSQIDIMKPHKMDNSAAPDNFLKIIKCNCAGKCDKNTCSCRKHALLCTSACGQCKGITCTNVGEDSEPAELMDSMD